MEKTKDLTGQHLEDMAQEVAQDLQETADRASKLKVSLKEARTKIRVKETGHKTGRMDIRIKLGPEEAEGFKNFLDLVMPPGMAQGDFVKFLFLSGIRKVQEQMTEDAARMLEGKTSEELEELAEQAGVEIPVGALETADEESNTND